MEKVLLILESDVTQKLLTDAIPGYEVRACNADQAAAALAQFHPDALILDLFLPGTDGFSLMEDLQSLLPPVVLLLTILDSDYVRKRAAHLGAGFVIQKPCTTEYIVKHLTDMLLTNQIPDSSDNGATVDYMLNQFSIRAKPRVLQALSRAILMRAEHPNHFLTKNIYPEICREYGASSDAVDQAIRRALRNAWDSQAGKSAFWDQVFPGCTECPSNDAFISTVALFLRKKYPSRFRKGS